MDGDSPGGKFPTHHGSHVDQLEIIESRSANDGHAGGIKGPFVSEDHHCRWRRALLFSAFLMLAGVTSIQAAPLIKLIGAWGGSVDAVVLQESAGQRIAYIGSGARFVILDVTHPADIVELGSVLLTGAVRDIKLRDGFAYIVAQWPAGLSIVNVANPSSPVLLSTQVGFGMGGSVFCTVELHGSRAYCLTLGYGGVCFDISNPQHPVNTSDSCMFGALPDTVVDGDVMYAASNYSEPQAGIGAMNITNNFGSGYPSCCLSFLPIPALADVQSPSVVITKAGNFVYATCSRNEPQQFDPNHQYWNSRVFTVDFSTPSAPVLTDTWASGPISVVDGVPTWTKGLAAANGRLYLANWKLVDDDDSPYEALTIFDIASNPAHPVRIGGYQSTGSATGVFALGMTVYLQEEKEGLVILDASNPAGVVRQGAFHSPAVLSRAIRDGSLLHVTDRRFGVTNVDVSNPLAPLVVGKFETGGVYNDGLAKREGTLYVSAGTAGLEVLDVSNPAAPALEGQWGPLPSPYRAAGIGLSVHDGYGLIASVGAYGPCICPTFMVNFTVDDPQDISDVGYSTEPLAFGARLASVAIGPNDSIFTCIESYDPGWYRLDNHDPSAIEVAYGGQPNGPTGCLNLDSGTWYVDGTDDSYPTGQGIYGFDITHPPEYEQTASYPGRISSSPPLLAYQSGRLYAVGDYAGDSDYPLHVMDVTNPSSITLLAKRSVFCAPVLDVGGGDLIVNGPYVDYVTGQHNDIGTGVLTFAVYEPGDMNSDNVVGVADVSGFVAVLVGQDASMADALIADMNGDGRADGRDVAAFVQRLLSP